MLRSLATNYLDHPTHPIAKPEEIRIFRVTPKVISFLIARTGFGHIDFVML
jgi:hypothetical protein